jgi:CheY-like chemotaxis protein
MEKGILVVEDNEDDVILMKFALEEAGIHNPVHVIETADRAMHYLAGEREFVDRSTYPLPRVIFVDLLLPGKSGHDLLSWMKSREELSDVVRAVLTGSLDPADMGRAYELGANCYFQKPLTVEQLTAPARNIRMLLCGPVLAEAA